MRERERDREREKERQRERDRDRYRDRERESPERNRESLELSHVEWLGAGGESGDVLVCGACQDRVKQGNKSTETLARSKGEAACSLLCLYSYGAYIPVTSQDGAPWLQSIAPGADAGRRSGPGRGGGSGLGAAARPPPPPPRRSAAKGTGRRRLRRDRTGRASRAAPCGKDGPHFMRDMRDGAHGTSVGRAGKDGPAHIPSGAATVAMRGALARGCAGESGNRSLRA